MDIDFVIFEVAEKGEFNVEKKTGTVFKSYRQRTVKFAKDSLKFYSDGAYKEEDLMLGAQTYATPNPLEVKIKLKDKKEMQTYRVKTAGEMAEFLDSVRRTIRCANVLGIQNGCRDPEVVEWYYQYQSDIIKRTAFMQLEKQEVCMKHTIPGHQTVSISYFHITMPSDRSGLLFTLNSAAFDGSPYSRFASLYNGRIVPFADITGAYITSGQMDDTGCSAEKPFSFVLHTKEDELTLEIAQGGVRWLRAVQALCIFATMPVPTSRNVTPNSPVSVTGHATTSPFEGFSKNSGVGYVISADVALMLQSLSTSPLSSRTLVVCVEEVHAVFRALSEVRCNRDASIILGERIENIIRVLSEPSVLAASNQPTKKEIFEPKIAALTVALQAVRAYIKTQRHAGWLKYNLENSSIPAKQSYDTLDANLMSVVNTLIGALGVSVGLMFEKKVYVSAVNVRKSVETLGGVEKIFNDPIKERSLAKVIQADGAEVRRELERMNGLVISSSQTSVHTSVTEIEDGNAYQKSHAASSRGCWGSMVYYLACGCLCSSSSSGGPKSSKKAHVRTAQASLKEPLVE